MIALAPYARAQLDKISSRTQLRFTAGLAQSLNSKSLTRARAIAVFPQRPLMIMPFTILVIVGALILDGHAPTRNDRWRKNEAVESFDEEDSL